MTPLLKISNLYVNFQVRKSKFSAVKNFNLLIEKNQIVGLVGESGSGKSVTAMSIMRLLQEPKASYGEKSSIEFDGELIVEGNCQHNFTIFRSWTATDCAGYSSTPAVNLRSSFNYVVNLDLGLLQFAFPHGITNGSPITLNVVDTGEGTEFPLSAGATGRLNGNTTYYAITGTANSLENDQLKIAITQANANLGDALAFVNAGTGRQQVLTLSLIHI